MWVRCGHRSWRPEKCGRCARFAEPRIACLECSGGLATTTIARGGALCRTHHHWAFRALHADVAGLPGYENAELLLRSRLWTRGVALHTGELKPRRSIRSRMVRRVRISIRHRRPHGEIGRAHV